MNPFVYDKFMYPFLPIGPVSLPTIPVSAILAIWLGLSVMARSGARQSLHPDQTLTAGFVAVAAGIIVARLWHVIQFWAIYGAEPLLAISPRPGGMALWPGIIAALIIGYAYLLRARLDPAKIAAAAVIGGSVAEALLQIGGFLGGSVVGMATDLPWGMFYFGEFVHPVGLYRAAGALVLAGLLFLRGPFARPWRVVLVATLGYALIRLVADAFVADAATVGAFRVSQGVALAMSLLSSWLLARMPRVDNLVS